ncbi:class I SAM-dependent methyltransferase [Amycolatopsis sp. WGS_07]|uniref:class I SAM-dependent methyltransferase n=1 Tax=Amycolatopsis sp. WGS_07 TaxID=3076764 RepID=UPI003872AFBB
MNAEVYDTAFYRFPIFRQVYQDEIRFVRSQDWTDSCLIEVGSGPGEFMLSFPGSFKMMVGVDRSKRLIEYAARQAAGDPSVHLISGDAAQLRQLLEECGPAEAENLPKLVSCVMNTLGILEPDVRSSVMANMAAILRPEDSFLIAVFNREHFGAAVESFYSANPDLCGTVGDGDYDLAAGDLRVESTGYYSHWFDEDELSNDLTTAGFGDFAIERHGVGLFAFGGRIGPLVSA